jgi:hypothetical protein
MKVETPDSPQVSGQEITPTADHSIVDQVTVGAAGRIMPCP